MHCTLQEIDKDSPKVSEAGKDSISTIHQQQNRITPFKVAQIAILFFQLIF